MFISFRLCKIFLIKVVDLRIYAIYLNFFFDNYEKNENNICDYCKRCRETDYDNYFIKI